MIIEKPKNYIGESLYNIFKKYFKCDFKKCDLSKDNQYEIKDYYFSFDGNDYFRYIFDILNNNVKDMSNVTGKDLEDAEIQFLICNLQSKLKDNNIFIDGDCYLSMWYNSESNKNMFRVKFYVKI